MKNNKLLERLDQHLQSIREESGIISEIDKFCKKLGFHQARKTILSPVYQYHNFNKTNYNHEIEYDAGDKVIIYRIYKLNSEKPFDQKEWQVDKNNLGKIFKEIKGEFDGHE